MSCIFSQHCLLIEFHPQRWYIARGDANRNFCCSSKPAQCFFSLWQRASSLDSSHIFPFSGGTVHRLGNMESRLKWVFLVVVLKSNLQKTDSLYKRIWVKESVDVYDSLQTMILSAFRHTGWGAAGRIWRLLVQHGGSIKHFCQGSEFTFRDHWMHGILQIPGKGLEWLANTTH